MKPQRGLTGSRSLRRGSFVAASLTSLALLACGAGEKPGGSAGGGQGGSPGTAGSSGGTAAGGATGGGATSGGSAGARAGDGGGQDLATSGSPPLAGSGGGPGPDAAPGDRGSPGGGQDAGGPTGGDAGGPGSTPGGPNVDRNNPGLFTLSFRPSEADPAARDRDLAQTAMLDTRAPRVQGKLVVVLAGVGGAPGPAGVGRWAAAQGFHALLIAYQNDFNPSNQNDPDFFGAARLEAFDGMDRTPRMTVARADSVEERLARAMVLLRTRHPGGDWGYYLDGQGQPRWPEIIFAGHSHGATSAAIYATVRPLHRAISLAGPRDVVPVTASWYGQPSVSPPDRFFGFTGTGDSQHQDHLKAFGLLKLPGAVVDVGTASPPYGGSHRLLYQGGHGDAASCDRYAAACRYMFGVR